MEKLEVLGKRRDEIDLNLSPKLLVKCHCEEFTALRFKANEILSVRIREFRKTILKGSEYLEIAVHNCTLYWHNCRSIHVRDAVLHDSETSRLFPTNMEIEVPVLQRGSTETPQLSLHLL
eukprot:GHVN01035056.1.p1 GENE.GHVN01035056.1~~GHVN01035056.1.p1  ORF type:complete len:120 (+),score=3.69 GHVN01035056.1:931-1290(+)